MVRMMGSKASTTLYLDPAILQKIDDERGIAKRSTFIEDKLKKIYGNT